MNHTIEKNDINFEPKDFVNYKFNNWKKVENNETLNEIDKKGGAVWLNQDATLRYRLSIDSPVTGVKNYKQANAVFSNYLNRNIKLIEGTKKSLPNVTIQELKMVLSDEFEPFKEEEFYEKDDLLYRNLFKPSTYLQMKADNSKKITETSFKAIEALIMNLTTCDANRFDYVINWLAYFFQGLKKSQVALVLHGRQGAGKGIFYNEIIKPLFGADYCMTVNDKSLRTSYLGGIVENEIFFNLDEISHQKTESKSIKNFLKALVTNDTITAEKKFMTLEKETKIYGQVLITSNELHVLDIEPSDRRYTIYTTGDNLMFINYLGYKTYDDLSKQIKNELESFAIYLKNYRVDVQMANRAEQTLEKQRLQELHRQQESEKLQRLQKNTTSKPIVKIPKAIITFANAIRNKSIAYFTDIKFENESLYNDIEVDFNKNLFKINNLLLAFQLLHGDELRIKYVSILLKMLRAYDPFQFSLSCYRKEQLDGKAVNYIFIIPYSIYSPPSLQY